MSSKYVPHAVNDEWQYDALGNRVGLRTTSSDGSVHRIGEWNDQIFEDSKKAKESDGVSSEIANSATVLPALT